MEDNLLSFRINIVFDNRCFNENFLTGFGFSALIYSHFTSNYLLFDTGGNANILIHNLQQFDVKVIDIVKIIISHNHQDHNSSRSL